MQILQTDYEIFKSMSQTTTKLCHGLLNIFCKRINSIHVSFYAKSFWKEFLVFLEIKFLSANERVTF